MCMRSVLVKLSKFGSAVQQMSFFSIFALVAILFC